MSVFWTDTVMAAIESGEGDTGAGVQTREEVQADMQAEGLAAVGWRDSLRKPDGRSRPVTPRPPA